MDEPTASENNGVWIRCQSKTRPGQYYMFNKESGQTKWCTTSQKTQPNILVQTKMKTPAQDRLKRLQKNLQKKHRDSSVAKTKDGQKNKRLDFPIDKQIVEDKPSTATEKSSTISSNNPEKAKETTNETKLTPQRNNEKDKPVEAMKEKISAQSDKKKFLSPKNPTSGLECKSSKKKAAKRKQEELIIPTCSSLKTEQIVVNPPLSKCSSGLRRESKSVSSPKKIRPSSEFDKKTSPAKCDLNDNIEPHKDQTLNIMSVIKGYCSSLFKKAVPADKPDEAKKQSNLSQKSRTSFKSKQSVPKCSKTESDFRANTSLPSFSSKGIANDRLQRLRRSLQAQQTVPNRPQQILSPDSNILNTADSNQRRESVCASRTSDPESVAMDWQPIFEDHPLNNSTSSSFSNVSLSNVSTRSEHLDIVNENLFRLAADKKQQEQHWKTDYFYFVVDTNVFLENITFVDELTTMKLCDTAGTLIYIPYCVLQELDKLKIRSPSESIKTRSTRAIHFINKAFQMKSQNIKAQSSADENKHLIKVTSPDDSILNCCLQVKEHIDNVMLLTEDINLRNKAMCSDILVSTKSDLISKHESLL